MSRSEIGSSVVLFLRWNTFCPIDIHLGSKARSYWAKKTGSDVSRWISKWSRKNRSLKGLREAQKNYEEFDLASYSTNLWKEKTCWMRSQLMSYTLRAKKRLLRQVVFKIFLLTLDDWHDEGDENSDHPGGDKISNDDVKWLIG